MTLDDEDVTTADDPSFEDFYAATAQYVFDFIRRAAGGDEQLAHDVVQEAYIAMMQNWSDRCTRTLVDNRRYVIGIASHKLVDAFRRQKKFEEFDDLDLDRASEDPEFYQIDNELSLFQAVRDLIAAQPPRRRIVGVLFFIEDHHYDEIAVMLGMAPSTVRTHIERLRLQLQHLIKRLGDHDQGGDRHDR